MGKQHVLIVEDEQILLSAVTVLLVKNGFNVSSATNGDEAYQIIVDNEFGKNAIDIVLCDIQMPVLTGIELAERLSWEGIPIPLVFMTGYMDEQVEEMVEEKHIRNLVHKPFENNYLLETIRRVLEERQTEAMQGSV